MTKPNLPDFEHKVQGKNLGEQGQGEQGQGEHGQGEQGQCEHKVRPYGTHTDSLGRILQAFKSITTNAYIRGVNQSGWPPFMGRLWQRNYYERVIRDEKELAAIREYILNNPIKWADDENNPNVT